ncbi:MAG TPA: methylenetetrahydrofolate reductase [NAD(P)H] [Clostridiales bacterium]|nr:methylenetetrahydrofolate reductase [NAD(P)H] [Clostridiales bacterium]
MKITELLKSDKLTMSFEVFPPKTDTSFESVKKATEEIAQMRPAYMSVTYGAGGGTSKYTLDIAQNIMKTCGVPTLAHLTCISSDRDTIHQRIKEIKEAGIKNVLALRGDLTPELMLDRSGCDYQYAAELVRDLKESGADFCIGGACYPEIHIESKNYREDIAHLKEKVDAGCEFLTTQMFFDNNIFYNYMWKLREAGINVPIIPGIMPITNGNQIDRAIKLSNSFMPRRFRMLVDKFGDNPDAMKQAGIAYTTEQVIGLYANGIKNVHIYTMNKPDIAKALLENLSDILG